MAIRQAVFFCVVIVTFIATSQAQVIDLYKRYLICLQYHFCQCNGEYESVNKCYGEQSGEVKRWSVEKEKRETISVKANLTTLTSTYCSSDPENVDYYITYLHGNDLELTFLEEPQFMSPFFSCADKILRECQEDGEPKCLNQVVIPEDKIPDKEVVDIPEDKIPDKEVVDVPEEKVPDKGVVDSTIISSYCAEKVKEKCKSKITSKKASLTQRKSSKENKSRESLSSYNKSKE